MNIVMMTNTYKPIIGGLERSVEAFTEYYRKKDHQVLIVTPEHQEALGHEEGVIRVPAIQHFNGTDFSVELPIHFTLLKELDQWKPDIIHSHHPFLIGDTALRASERYQIPIVFTHHTLFEQYTHYVPVKARALKDFVVGLAVGYANLCDHVFAPSESIRDLIKERGIIKPVSVVPTGIETEKFLKGDGEGFREKYGIRNDCFLCGTVGRVAKEKNTDFLMHAIARFLKDNDRAEFVVVGQGDALKGMSNYFDREGLSERFHTTGSLQDQELVDAYHAMDVFVFASHSETQGLVLIEAMACGVPVVAVDAPGVREVCEERVNGRLISRDNEKDFCEALNWMANLDKDIYLKMKSLTRQKAEEFTQKKVAEKALAIYEELILRKYKEKPLDDNPWSRAVGMIKAELKLLQTYSQVSQEAIKKNGQKENHFQG